MKLVLLMLFLGVAHSETLIYEIEEGSIFEVDQTSLSYTLESNPVLGLISLFIGPCGMNSCDVATGTPFDLQYTVENATSCIGSRGTLSWQTSHPSSDGAHFINISSITQNTSFTLNCSNSGIGASSSLSVSMTVDGNSTCSTSMYPPGLTRVNNTYQSVNDGFEFGVTTNTDVTLNISTSEFMTLSGFNLPFINFRRRIDFVSAPTNFNTMRIASVSVSECPGDFTGNAVCTKSIENFRSMRFSNNQADNPLLYCILDPTKNYYINFVHSESPYSESPSCNDSQDSICAVFYTETSL